jgi:hypothetical protein
MFILSNWTLFCWISRVRRKLCTSITCCSHSSALSLPSALLVILPHPPPSLPFQVCFGLAAPRRASSAASHRCHQIRIGSHRAVHTRSSFFPHTPGPSPFPPAMALCIPVVVVGEGLEGGLSAHPLMAGALIFPKPRRSGAAVAIHGEARSAPGSDLAL